MLKEVLKEMNEPESGTYLRIKRQTTMVVLVFLESLLMTCFHFFSHDESGIEEALTQTSHNLKFKKLMSV